METVGTKTLGQTGDKDEITSLVYVVAAVMNWLRPLRLTRILGRKK